MFLYGDVDNRVWIESPEVILELVCVVVESELTFNHTVELQYSLTSLSLVSGQTISVLTLIWERWDVCFNEENSVNSIKLKRNDDTVTVWLEALFEIIVQNLRIPLCQRIDGKKTTFGCTTTKFYNSDSTVLVKVSNHLLGLIFLPLVDELLNILIILIKMSFTQLELVVNRQEVFVDGSFQLTIDHNVAGLHIVLSDHNLVSTTDVCLYEKI